MGKYCKRIRFAVFLSHDVNCDDERSKAALSNLGTPLLSFPSCATPRLLQSTSNWTLLTFFRIPISIENHANVLRVPFHHNLLMGRRRDSSGRGGRWWVGRQINANQIIDELIWEARTRDHHHKNQLMDGECRCGCRKNHRRVHFFCRNHLKHLFSFSDKGVLRYEMKFLSNFHYVDEIKCVKNLYISRLSILPFSGDINLCR